MNLHDAMVAAAAEFFSAQNDLVEKREAAQLANQLHTEAIGLLEKASSKYRDATNLYNREKLTVGDVVDTVRSVEHG